jgi:thioredoxin-like negative regulator of GroEL
MYSAYTNAYHPTDDVNKNSVNDLINVTKKTFSDFLSEYDIVVVDVWAPWCGPCLAAGEKLKESLPLFQNFIENKNLIFVKDNIDDEDSVHGLDVRAVPSFFIYFQGEIVFKLNGFNMQEIENHVNYLLQNLGQNKLEEFSLEKDESSEMIRFPQKNIGI